MSTKPHFLIAATNGQVMAIDPTTGEGIWATALQNGIFSATSGADVCILVAGDLIYAGASGHLFCLSVEDGRILWHNPLKGYGRHDITLAMDGISVQWLKKTIRTSNPSTSS